MDAELAVIDEEVYEGEVVEGELVYEPLTKKQAVALDKKVRATSDKVTTNVNALVDLLEEAMNGNIHEVLEFASWTAWVKDAVQINVNDKLERKSLVSLMSGKGMSQRAIAGTLGVSQKTVDRDLDESDDSGDAEVIGLDGKNYTKSKKSKVVDPEPEEEAPTRAAPITSDFRDEVYNLQNVVEALKDLIYEDDRFPKARPRIAKSKSNDEFRSAIDELDGLLSVINGEEAEEEEFEE
jgi:transposase